ncbi:hypothetical protein N7508_004678, partial [Penicillium antarcticum]|uniref:uncharacterized protein n=1 Tax=Penicillium antarcticum TaxID=416450 RepID=UPI002392337C
SNSHSGTFQTPSTVQNGNSKANFDIPSPKLLLDIETWFSLDAPWVHSINVSVFNWWYFDVVSKTNSGDSLVITLSTSSFAAFPFLQAIETSVTTAYLWASFANGTVFADSFRRLSQLLLGQTVLVLIALGISYNTLGEARVANGLYDSEHHLISSVAFTQKRRNSRLHRT